MLQPTVHQVYSRCGIITNSNGRTQRLHCKATSVNAVVDVLFTASIHTCCPATQAVLQP